MIDISSLVLILVLLGILLLSGFYVACALFLAGMAGLYLIFEGNLHPVQVAIWTTANNPTLAVLVFYVAMGEMLLEGGLSAKLYTATARFLDRVPGGLLHVNIVACTICSAAMGSSMATAATFGKTAYIEGERRGYKLGVNLGSLAGGATLGILIPPSVIMIVYGVITETSIGQLYMAGVIPGLLISGFFLLYIFIRVLFKPTLVPGGKAGYSWWERLSGLIGVLPTLLVILCVLGTIYLGIATPAEAGAVGALACMILGFAYRGLTLQKLWFVLIRTSRITAMCIFLLIGAKLLSFVVVNMGISAVMIQWLTDIEASWTVVLTIIIVIYLVLGAVFDSFSCIALTVPLLLPLVLAYNFDPILFGIVVVILIEVGLITPPFGINLFILDSVTGGGHFGEIARESLPFVFLLLFGLIIVLIFPQVALWLPSIMLGGS